LIALPYLPLLEMVTTYNDLIAELRYNNPQLFEEIDGFLEYYFTQWISNETILNVLNISEMDHATNNLVESWHSKILKEFGLHQGFWKFIKNVQLEFEYQKVQQGYYNQP
jgi:hypothetical protein